MLPALTAEHHSFSTALSGVKGKRSGDAFWSPHLSQPWCSMARLPPSANAAGGQACLLCSGVCCVTGCEPCLLCQGRVEKRGGGREKHAFRPACAKKLKITIRK